MEVKKDKKNYLKDINCGLFILMFAFRSITDAIFVSKGIESNIWINLKYLFLIVGIIIGVFQMKNKKKIFTKEFFYLTFTVMMLFVISCICILINSEFSSLFFESIIKLILPIIYVYVFLNIVEFQDIYKSMIAVLILSFLGYVFEIGFSNFNMNNLATISFQDSYSPFESHFSSGTAIAMCAFFMYYRREKKWMLLSFIFALFTFKRMSILFAIFLLVLPKFIDINKDANKKLKGFIKVFFIISTLAYYCILLPNNSEIFYKIFGENQASLTMGRSDFLARLISREYKISGLGSIANVIGRGLEMDLISIYLETSIIGLCIFVNCYWSCAGNKIYTYIYMLFQFINLLTSHSLSNSFNWILAFVIIGTISYKNSQQFSRFSRKGVDRIYEKNINNNTNL